MGMANGKTMAFALLAENRYGYPENHTDKLATKSRTRTVVQRWIWRPIIMPKPTAPVIVTDPDGKENRFPSVTAAAKYIGVIPPRVSTACTLGIRLHGYRVRYENGVGQ